MTSYTTPYSLPIIEFTDKIKDSAVPTKLGQDINDLATATNAALEANKADATTKYGGLPARVAAVEAKQHVACVRLESGKWVWDTAAGTHFVIPDHTGALIVRPTAAPVPAATSKLDW